MMNEVNLQDALKHNGSKSINNIVKRHLEHGNEVKAIQTPTGIDEGWQYACSISGGYTIIVKRK